MDLIDDVFLELKKLIGNTIDIYGTNRIYKDHVELLISIIKKKIDKNNETIKRQTLLFVLKELLKAEEGFLAIGD